MQRISEFMLRDHRACDDRFAMAENAAVGHDLAAWAENHEKFRQALERHFRMEEDVLFPAFEHQTGMTSGPTEVMRSEHNQMREAMERMAEAVADRDRDAYLGESETLLILMQQHNIKEESVLYPMSDQALAPRAEELLEQMSVMA